MFADGNRAWRRAATQANVEFYQVRHCLLECSRVVTAQNGQTIKAGTQTLDKNWGHMKRFIPNSITTKDVTSGLLNGDIWDYAYQWQWRYNNRDRLWETVPQILAEIADHHWWKRHKATSKSATSLTATEPCFGRSFPYKQFRSWPNVGERDSFATQRASLSPAWQRGICASRWSTGNPCASRSLTTRCLCSLIASSRLIAWQLLRSFTGSLLIASAIAWVAWRRPNRRRMRKGCQNDLLLFSTFGQWGRRWASEPAHFLTKQSRAQAFFISALQDNRLRLLSLLSRFNIPGDGQHLIGYCFHPADRILHLCLRRPKEKQLKQWTSLKGQCWPNRWLWLLVKADRT